jgi:Putative Flp pilus-assembly TadE/G-like
MKNNFSRVARSKKHEAGQSMVFVLLALGLFLVAAIAFAVDLSNMWFHRQMAQTAADAACTAGVMDLLVNTEEGKSLGGLKDGSGNYTTFDCNARPAASPCQYAALNSYNSNITASGTTVGNNVSVLFPATGPTGVTAPPASIAATPFMRVEVLDNVQTYFSGLLSGNRAQGVRAAANCGILLAESPIPILVLDPQNPTRPSNPSAFDIQGSPTVAIIGGPAKSIQVNSNATLAANIGGNALLDLSLGGPGNPGTGSDIGLYGGPSATPLVPKNFKPGTTGHWAQPSTPINDPFQQMAAPSTTGMTTRTGPIGTVATGVHGCPDTSCDEYAAGHYTSTIQIKNTTAIFQEGIYYITGDFTADSNSCIRPSTQGATLAADQIGGMMFYLSGSGGLDVNANSGNKCPSGAAFSTTAGAGPFANGVKCTATSTIPSNLPATLTGNVLLAPCTGVYGDQLVAAGKPADPTLGVQRGILFFQDRSLQSTNPSWGGGGTFLLAGTMYFHSCNASGTGTGCGAAPTWWNDIFTLQGGSGSTTYVLGDIVVDNLALGGNSGINMNLNPTSAFTILKAALLPERNF